MVRQRGLGHRNAPLLSRNVEGAESIDVHVLRYHLVCQLLTDHRAVSKAHHAKLKKKLP